MIFGKRTRTAFLGPAVGAIAVLVVLQGTPRAGPDKVALSDDVSLGDLFELMGQDIERQVPPQEFREFAFRSNFRFPRDAVWRNPALDEDARKDQIFGIDISHHLTDRCGCKVDWALLARQNVRFAYLKATQGVRYYDPSFEVNLKGIRALPADGRIDVGAFHFLSADGSGGDQAANYLEVVGGMIGDGDLVPSLDVEWDVRTNASGHVIRGADGKAKDFWAGTDGKEILARIVDWIGVVEKSTGKAPIIYTNATWWRERIGDAGKIEDLQSRYKIWISDLSSKGLKVEQPYVYKDRWDLWQFTFTAVADQGGLPTGRSVDADVFNGDAAAFDKVLKR